MAFQNENENPSASRAPRIGDVPQELHAIRRRLDILVIVMTAHALGLTQAVVAALGAA